MDTVLNAFQYAMGSTVSSAVNYARWMFGCTSNTLENDSSVVPLAQPFIYVRRSSMYLDEDGDVAHAFYEEMQPPTGKPRMKRIRKNLMDQGMVKLSHPRLHVDFPIAVYEG